MTAAFLVFLLLMCGLGASGWKALRHRRVRLPRSRTIQTGEPDTSQKRLPAAIAKWTRHPRLDLATGFVPAVQQRQASLHSFRQEPGPTLAERPDRIYAEDAMGDLSDPDADRTVRYPAYSGGSRNPSRP